LLWQAGTNLHRVSQITKRPPYGDGTAFVIPHWFYSELARGGTPHICQIVAVSEITGVRLEDWMAVFGYCLDDVPRLQMALVSPRPIVVNAADHHREPLGSPLSTEDDGYAYQDVRRRRFAVSPRLALEACSVSIGRGQRSAQAVQVLLPSSRFSGAPDLF
jgi:hypothetical protein